MTKIVDWSSLSVFYGEAKMIPELLSDLSSSSEKCRDQAMNDLIFLVLDDLYMSEAAYYLIDSLMSILENSRMISMVPALTILSEITSGNNDSFIIAAENGYYFTLENACRIKLLTYLPRIKEMTFNSRRELDLKQTIIGDIESYFSIEEEEANKEAEIAFKEQKEKLFGKGKEGHTK